MPPAIHTPWPRDSAPSEREIEAAFAAEGLSPTRWSNAPGDRYGGHSHPYHKVLYCIRGRITFILIDEGETIELRPGDRLDIPPGALHAAVVGPEGVACAEAARR